MERLALKIKNLGNQYRLELIEEIRGLIDSSMIDDDFYRLLDKLEEKYKLVN